MKQDKVLVACPRCGHTQSEPAAAYSSVCRKCRQHFRLEDVRQGAAGTRPSPGNGSPVKAPPAPHPHDVRLVACFQCGTELEVPSSAQSTMCKRCSSHLDLRDYQINSAVSKNFRTHGRFIIEESGYVFNTETLAAHVVLKGRFLGKLNASHTLELHRTAELKGTFQTGKLILPAGSLFRWPETITPGSADIAGELIAGVKSPGQVMLRSTARLFGDLEARELVVECGAVVVGHVRVGALASSAALRPAPAVPAAGKLGAA
jgi:cytoskeletal protein CcmA (bactofilin family)/DNA-directed RNA polymerase subunit RPC12/RpoP